MVKRGSRVRYCEEVALKLVKEHTKVPIPQFINSIYEEKLGDIATEYIAGRTVKEVWTELNHDQKKKLCQAIWDYVLQWRTIPRPPHLMNHI